MKLIEIRPRGLRILDHFMKEVARLELIALRAAEKREPVMLLGAVVVAAQSLVLNHGRIDPSLELKCTCIQQMSVGTGSFRILLLQASEGLYRCSELL
ncbi:MAG: hypothetical protein FJ194_12300 [Gammaproteobacteria bacterium]|nr:hypothetical protein [Gammaproteobacteria bacterium]